MGHRQQMTDKDRVQWDAENYKKRLEANKGSNYAYWSEKHDTLLENGWELHKFRVLDQRFDLAVSTEFTAQCAVQKLRSENNFARIVCGYDKNKIRIKMYSVIYKKKT